MNLSEKSTVYALQIPLWREVRGHIQDKTLCLLRLMLNDTLVDLTVDNTRPFKLLVVKSNSMQSNLDH